MNKYLIVGVCQVYNEIEKGNLERFFKYIRPLVDVLIAYDDCSTDGSYEYALEHADLVIRGKINNFSEEIKHKQLLLNEALKYSPQFILWLDVDEVLTGDRNRLEELCEECEDNNYDGVSLKEINLWRSHGWERIDSLYNEGWFTRIWSTKNNLSYEIKTGLHASMVPNGVDKILKSSKLSVIHYGFYDEKNISYKYLTYKKHGQTGYFMLDRLLDESKLVLNKVKEDLIPDALRIQNESAPIKKSFAESLNSVYKYRREILKPRYSIACLIYKDVDWLKFVYEQVLKYTDLSNKEFYFVVNDGEKQVLEYLEENYIPHYVFDNSDEHRKEWYINNVYRAFNYAAKMASGDFIIFINSDMAFSPNWAENLINKYDGHNCVASRLVESGKFVPGEFGIKKNFGFTIEGYQENNFQKYAQNIGQEKTKNGGLFMPLLVKKSDFMGVNGYPEGNVKINSDINNPSIATKEEEHIAGDKIFMEKLLRQGVRHQTSFDSIVYHFQCGERDSVNNQKNTNDRFEIAIVNDMIGGTMGEKVFWNFMLDGLPYSYGIDHKKLNSNNREFKKKCEKFLETKNNTHVIIQNATFIDGVDSDKFTISFLQDDLRAMNKKSIQQEMNLKNADKIITNSVITAASYKEYDCEIIPVGVDDTIFLPKNKKILREKHNLKKENIIGIFVGDFSEVKGWNKVKTVIENHKEIFWILVSKKDETYNADNVVVYNKIEQDLLSELYCCADFFILGSPTETQCLAAIEAALSGIPIIMHKTGIFNEIIDKDLEKIGYFGNDFEKGISDIINNDYSPRETILEYKVTVKNSIEKWKKTISSIRVNIDNKRLNKKYKNIINNNKNFSRFFILKEMILNPMDFNLKYQIIQILKRLKLFNQVKKIYKIFK